MMAMELQGGNHGHAFEAWVAPGGAHGVHSHDIHLWPLGKPRVYLEQINMDKASALVNICKAHAVFRKLFINGGLSISFVEMILLGGKPHKSCLRSWNSQVCWLNHPLLMVKSMCFPSSVSISFILDIWSHMFNTIRLNSALKPKKCPISMTFLLGEEVPMSLFAGRRGRQGSLSAGWGSPALIGGQL